MEFYENNEVYEESSDSYISEDNTESDSDFDYNGIIDDIDELQISEEDSDANEMEENSLDGSQAVGGGFTSISLKEITPISIFRDFFTEEILNLITDQTNIYGKDKEQRKSQRKVNSWKNISKKDIESFLGIIILMGINGLPKMRLYWSKDIAFRNNFISSIMSRDRFFQIFYNLHLADNSLEPKRESKDYSRIYKVKNFTEILLENFPNNYNFGQYGSIDETMVKFKGRSTLKQYIPAKPIKRGYKLWCLCDSITGYLFNCKIYVGKENTGEQGTLLGERAVFSLISGHSFEGKNLYFDNFFTSIELLEKLKLQNIIATGTIRSDRAGIPPHFTVKEKMERGNFKSIIVSNTIIFKWMDTKHVFLASNNCEDNKVVPVSRQLKSGQYITINCPKAINDYNKFTRGVDRFNQRISYYTFDHRSRRNWLRLFIFFLNASIFNSFICYNQLAQDKLSYLNYMVSIAKSLCSGAERRSRGRPPSETSKVASSQSILHLDNEMHLPVKGTRRRCAYCSTKEEQVRSTIECYTCKLAFCVTDEKNCFFDYHKVFM